jgi:pimeloyl-ACP methyl ester carboxylesterase
MRLAGFALTGLLLSALPAFAQTLDGDWNGALDTPSGRHVRMLFHFSHAGDVLEARFVAVDQAGATFPGDIKLEGQHLTVSMSFGGAYDGDLAADGKSITGHWTQRGISLPLTLIPGGIAAATLSQPRPGDLTIQTGTGVLAGTILRKGPIGAVIIAGSGPNNRDGMRGTYRDIAEALAAHDITTLRFDKRGVGESAPAMTREEDLRLQIFAEDAKAWAAELKRRIGARCVWLAGHSEGGVLAIMAAQGNPDICGLVLFASPGRPVTILLREQLGRQLPPAEQTAAFAVLDDLDAGRPVTHAPPQQLASLFRPSILPFFRSQIGLDPAALLARLKIPVLILQGDADVQVSLTDAKALAKARPDATLKILPGVNHGQRIAASDSSASPLAPGEMDMVADFMHQHSP